MIILIATFGIALYFAVRLPRKVKGMTEEEYRQYFCTHIMGIK